MKKYLHFPLLALATLLSAGTSSAQTSNTENLYLVHGLPGSAIGMNPALPVDISLNGNCVVKGEVFGEVKTAANLPLGIYRVAISPANALNPCGTPSILDGNVNLAYGGSAALVIALVNRQPTAYPYSIDLSSVPGYLNKIIFYHTADAPPATFKAYDESNTSQGQVMANTGQKGETAVRAYHVYDFQVTVPGANGQQVLNTDHKNVVLGSRDLTLVFLVGSSADGANTLIIKKIPLVY